MGESKVIRINQTFYVRVPAAEARRLGLAEGQRVEIRVRPIGAKAEEILKLRGKYKGEFRTDGDEDLWGA